MNQTSYNKTGGKANFFPSTATATTNGSSGNGSSDPRRTTDAGSRQPSISNQSNQNNQIDLNLQLRFNKNQIRLNGGANGTRPSDGSNGTPGICQTTKNAWQAVDLQASTKRDSTLIPSTTTNAQGGHQQILF